MARKAIVDVQSAFLKARQPASGLCGSTRRSALQLRSSHPRQTWRVPPASKLAP